jgi:hypothetical protein
VSLRKRMMRSALTSRTFLTVNWLQVLQMLLTSYII